MPIFARMQLTVVTNIGTAQQFIKVAVQLYKNDPNWIQPLDKDINDTFDKKKNKAWRFGEAIRWILKDEKGNLLGRIAAFTNKKYRNKGDDIAIGGIGFFECINNQDAANMLLDKAKEWLQQHGMQAMDGPINFGERDKCLKTSIRNFVFKNFASHVLFIGNNMITGQNGYSFSKEMDFACISKIFFTSS